MPDPSASAQQAPPSRPYDCSSASPSGPDTVQGAASSQHAVLTQILSSAAAAASAHGFQLQTMTLASSPNASAAPDATVVLDGVPCVIPMPASHPPQFLMQPYQPLQTAYPMHPYYAAPTAYFTQPSQNLFWSTVMPPGTNATNAAATSSTPPASSPPAKEFMCPRCKSSFKTNSNMQKHIRTVHENCRPFKCDRCDASYGHKNLLVEHIRTAHERKRPFACNTCGARFGRSSNLYSHMKSHDGKREHKCETCHVSFSLHGNMVKHIKTVHLKQRPFLCTICNSRFGLRSDLTRHTRNVHGIIDPNANSNKRIRLSSNPAQTPTESASIAPHGRPSSTLPSGSGSVSASASASASVSASALTDEITPVPDPTQNQHGSANS